MRSGLNPANKALALRAMLAAPLVAALALAAPALSAEAAPPSPAPATQAPVASSPHHPPPGENEQSGYADPLAPFNESMFTFNLKLDDWVLHPVASGYATIAPQPVRESVGRFFDNVRVIPRFANNLFQLKLAEAGVEVARFGINSTVGVAGLFDPAKVWFGLKPRPNDFGLTLRYYSAPTGPYLMLPFLGPSTIGDTVGMVADGAMDPMGYLLPWWVTLAASGGENIADAVNYRSLHLDEFEQADRYAIDLYGAVQDAYLQTRVHDVKRLHEEEW